MLISRAVMNTEKPAPECPGGTELRIRILPPRFCTIALAKFNPITSSSIKRTMRLARSATILQLSCPLQVPTEIAPERSEYPPDFSSPFEETSSVPLSSLGVCFRRLDTHAATQLPRGKRARNVMKCVVDERHFPLLTIIHQSPVLIFKNGGIKSPFTSNSQP